MFIRAKRVRQNGRIYEYFLIVESTKTATGPRQETIANLGRKDQLEPDALDKLVRSMAPLAQGTVIFNPTEATEGYRGSRVFGPLPVFGRLFEDLGIGPLLRQAETALPLDHAVFAMVASRLMDPGSKLRTFEDWLPEVYFPPFAGLKLQHFYRALDLPGGAEGRPREGALGPDPQRLRPSGGSGARGHDQHLGRGGDPGRSRPVRQEQ